MTRIYFRHLLLRATCFAILAYLVSAIALVTSTFLDATTDKNHALATDVGLALGVAHAAAAPFIGLFAAIGGATLYGAQGRLSGEYRILRDSGLSWRVMNLPGLVPALLLALSSSVLLFLTVPRAEATIRELSWVDSDRLRDALLFQGRAQVDALTLLEGAPAASDHGIDHLRLAVGKAPALPFLLWAEHAEVRHEGDGVIELELDHGGAAGRAVAPALEHRAIGFDRGLFRIPLELLFKRHEGRHWSRPEFRRADRLLEDARVASLHPLEADRADGYRFEFWRRIILGLAPLLAAIQIQIVFHRTRPIGARLFPQLLQALFILGTWVLGQSTALSFSRSNVELGYLFLASPLLLGALLEGARSRGPR